jgi:hypothetical protein
MGHREGLPVDLTTDAVKDIAAECLTTCGYWRWGQARIGPEDQERPILPGEVNCDHGAIYDELADNGQHELCHLFVRYYLDGANILKREMTSFRGFN